MQTSRAGVDRDRVSGAEVVGEFLFEPLGFGPSGDPAGPETVDNLGNLLLANYR
jgi:hypothetical protein